MVHPILHFCATPPDWYVCAEPSCPRHNSGWRSSTSLGKHYSNFPAHRNAATPEGKGARMTMVTTKAAYQTFCDSNTTGRQPPLLPSDPELQRYIRSVALNLNTFAITMSFAAEAPLRQWTLMNALPWAAHAQVTGSCAVDCVLELSAHLSSVFGWWETRAEGQSGQNSLLRGWAESHRARRTDTCSMLDVKNAYMAAAVEVLHRGGGRDGVPAALCARDLFASTFDLTGSPFQFSTIRAAAAPDEPPAAAAAATPATMLDLAEEDDISAPDKTLTEDIRTVAFEHDSRPHHWHTPPAVLAIDTSFGTKRALAAHATLVDTAGATHTYDLAGGILHHDDHYTAYWLDRDGSLWYYDGLNPRTPGGGERLLAFAINLGGLGIGDIPRNLRPHLTLYRRVGVMTAAETAAAAAAEAAEALKRLALKHGTTTPDPPGTSTNTARDARNMLLRIQYHPTERPTTLAIDTAYTWGAIRKQTVHAEREWEVCLIAPVKAARAWGKAVPLPSLPAAARMTPFTRAKISSAAQWEMFVEGACDDLDAHHEREADAVKAAGNSPVDTQQQPSKDDLWICVLVT
ncbi:hypothetical protein DFH27DRAFT_311194 [Peziza echinospora]|nr:hypothetical protein DFH27DRAFT_311194 [Peziza echinospora]